VRHPEQLVGLDGPAPTPDILEDLFEVLARAEDHTLVVAFAQDLEVFQHVQDVV